MYTYILYQKLQKDSKIIFTFPSSSNLSDIFIKTEE